MEVSFQLRRDKLTKKGFAPIQITFCWEGSRLRMFSGEKCRPEHWDTDGEEVIYKKNNFSGDINKQLADLKHVADTAHRQAQESRRLLTEAELRAALDAFLKPAATESVAAAAPPEPVDVRPLFFRLMAQWIEEHSAKLNPRTFKPVPRATILGLNATMKRFEQFAEAKQLEPTLEGMTPAFYETFQHYMLQELGQEVNTFGKHVARLRAFLSWCEDQDLPVNRRYRKFVAPSRYVGVDSLTEQELRRIQAIDFTSAEVQARLHELRKATREKGHDAGQWSFQRWAAHIELARDKFLVCAYTALRISDAEQLAWHHVKEQMIQIRAGKTQLMCYIPFYDDDLFKLEALAAKYHGRAPDGLLLPTCYRVNEFLKVVQQLASFTRLPLTTKLGRKTYVTTQLYRGVPARMVMQATGHTTEKSFNHYVGVDTLKLLHEFVRRSPGMKRTAA